MSNEKTVTEAMLSEKNSIDAMFDLTNDDILKTITLIGDDEIAGDVDMDMIACSSEAEKRIEEMMQTAAETDNKSKSKRKSKKPIEEIVNSYISTRSEKDWSELMAYYWWGIHSYAYKFTQNMDIAYDLTIETFIQAYEVIDQYNPEKGKFSTWLWVICRNKCLSFLSRKKKNECIVNNDISEVFESEMNNPMFVNNELDLMDFVPNDLGEMECHSIGDADRDLYNILIEESRNFKDDDIRNILLMRFVEQQKLVEISKKLDIKLSSVKNKYYKACDNLARIIKVNHKDAYERYLENCYEKAMATPN